MNNSIVLLFFAFCDANFEGRPRTVAPLSLCVLCCLFHLSDFGFHRFYQLGELFLAFLSCLGIYVLGYAFPLTLGVNRPS